MAQPSFITGDLLDQDVDVIVNPWNRNFIPWWLLLPQGVSGAIRRRAGVAPLREVSRKGLLPAGAAVLTTAGRLSFKGIIHVAGLNAFWVSTERTIRASTRNALDLAAKEGFRSIAFPLIGAGTGGKNPDSVQRWMAEEIASSPYEGRVVVVRFQKRK